MTREHDAHLLSGGYALHALTEEEAALVEAAMAESEELRGEVVGMVDTAVALGLAVPVEAPPAALRGRLLDAIADLPQEPAAVRTAEPEADEPVARPVPAHVVPHRRRRRRRLPVLITSGVLAAAVLFGGGIAVWNAVLQPQTSYTAIGQAADHREAEAHVAGGGTATVTWSASQDRTAVVLSGVRAPSGRVLQLWAVHGGSFTSEGVYTGGPAVLSGIPTSGEQLAVSVEPTGGSKQPTTDPIATVPLRS